jgi:apoptosis-inducing factor 3
LQIIQKPRGADDRFYDTPINYVGHAEKWDSLDIEGDPKSRDCLVRYRRNGEILAAASIYRDLDCLKEAEATRRADL